VASNIEYNAEKFRELLLYIAQQMESDESFGATVLNKVLYFSDFYSYRFDGAPITGAVYQKLNYGPAPRQLLREQQNLIEEGRAALQKRQFGDFFQKRLIALSDPKLELFTGEEIANVNVVINAFKGSGATKSSRFSHAVSVGWQAMELGENIEYGTVFLAPPMAITPAQEIRAKELAKAHVG
jgi:hypothetical protein